MSFFCFTILVALALLSFCIKLVPAQSPPPPPPLSSPPCSLNSSWISENAPIDENTRKLTLFKLSFLTNQSLSFTFTSTSTDDIAAPNLAFITLMRPLEQEPASYDCVRQKYTFSQPLRCHLICNPLPQELILQAPPSSCISEPDLYDSDDAHFTDVASLMYDPAAASLHLLENLSSGVTTKEIFSKKHLQQPYAVDSTVNNESLTLFVGYIITGYAGEASIINVTRGELTMNTSTPSPSRRVSLVVIHDDDDDDDDDDHESKHNHVGMGAIVGVCVLIGLILIISIRHGPFCVNCMYNESIFKGCC